MTRRPDDSSSRHNARHSICTVVLTACALFSLLGCADTHWERAFYQGATARNEKCLLQRKTTEAPCAEWLDYESYERERARAKNESPPSSRVNPIEEQQQ
ncbi:MAG: hypothetical protein V4858_04220 [Pseudomonadota bacterium]